jgi:N-acetyltransferase 10
MDGLLNPELLQQYAIVDREADFENALPSKGKILSGGLVSLKSCKNKIEKHGNQKESHKSGKKRSKADHRSNSNKKKRS